MRPSHRLPRSLLLMALALVPLPATGQNLLANPGFDRDLAGWLTSTVPVAPSPDGGLASIAWNITDASSSSLSGSISLHAKATATTSSARASAAQCVAVAPGTLATISARILTARQIMAAGASVTVAFFSSPDCSGTQLARASADALPFVTPQTSSDGRWLYTTTQALASRGARSVLAELSARASYTRVYGSAEVEAIADDAVFTLAPVTTTTWILPSAGWVHGAQGSYWRTRLTLSNPGPVDAAVTLKWLGHDTDGRGGYEFPYFVPAGHTLSPHEGTWEANFPEDWGAILVSSSSPAVLLQSETWTFLSGGSVGQAVPALGPTDFASATSKTLAPIRENDAHRTNLVLANPTGTPLTVQVALYDELGMLVGTRNVALQPLGMTQLNSVAAVLGVPVLDLGRIAVSTSTPSGLVAAYASVIDNATNDPRTLLPR